MNPFFVHTAGHVPRHTRIRPCSGHSGLPASVHADEHAASAAVSPLACPVGAHRGCKCSTSHLCFAVVSLKSGHESEGMFGGNMQPLAPRLQMQTLLTVQTHTWLAFPVEGCMACSSDLNMPRAAVTDRTAAAAAPSSSRLPVPATPPMASVARITYPVLISASTKQTKVAPITSILWHRVSRVSLMGAHLKGT